MSLTIFNTNLGQIQNLSILSRSDLEGDPYLVFLKAEDPILSGFPFAVVSLILINARKIKAYNIYTYQGSLLWDA